MGPGHVNPGRHGVKIFVAEGGTLPRRSKPGDAALDVCPRAVIHRIDRDKEPPHLGRTFFDFKRWPADDPLVEGHIVEVPKLGNDGQPLENGEREFAYVLMPGQKIYVGIGFATAMPEGMSYKIYARSSGSLRFNLEVFGQPYIIDADFRGEARIPLVNHNQYHPIYLRRSTRVAQIMFGPEPNPTIIQVATYDELGLTERGAGGVGSTGVHSPTRPS